MDRPFARGEIEDNHQRAERKNCHATFHVNLQNIRSAVPTGKLSSASQAPCGEKTLRMARAIHIRRLLLQRHDSGAQIRSRTIKLRKWQLCEQ
jgi:hypothetical protein